MKIQSYPKVAYNFLRNGKRRNGSYKNGMHQKINSSLPDKLTQLLQIRHKRCYWRYLFSHVCFLISRNILLPIKTAYLVEANKTSTSRCDGVPPCQCSGSHPKQCTQHSREVRVHCTRTYPGRLGCIAQWV